MMNPETNKFEPVDPKFVKDEGTGEFKMPGESEKSDQEPVFVRKNGEKADSQLVFSVGERVVIKGYKFEVVQINEDELVLAPIGLMYKTVAKRAIPKGTGASKRKRKSGSRRR
jgi:hypothetical protein